MCRRGVACDHDRFHALHLEIIGDLPAVTANGVRTLRSVRDPCRVTEIDDAFGGKLTNDLLSDRQASDAGVEHADRRLAHRYHGILPTRIS